MPAGNRVDTSRSLRTTGAFFLRLHRHFCRSLTLERALPPGIWANTIGHDPYAPTQEAAQAAGGNVYEQSKGLLAQARLAGGVVVDAERGLWKGTGRLKGYRLPGRGGPEEEAAAAAPLPLPPPEKSDSDLSESDSEVSEERRRRKAKRREKKEERRRRKEAKRSRSRSRGGSDSEARRKHRRHKEKKRRKEAKE